MNWYRASIRRQAASPMNDYAWIAPDGTWHPLTRLDNTHPKWLWRHARKIGLPKELSDSYRGYAVDQARQLNDWAVSHGWARFVREGEHWYVESPRLNRAQRQALEDRWYQLPENERLPVMQEYENRQWQILPERAFARRTASCASAPKPLPARSPLLP